MHHLLSLEESIKLKDQAKKIHIIIYIWLFSLKKIELRFVTVPLMC